MPEIYIRPIWTNRPRANNINSEIRRELDKRRDRGQFVFLLTPEGKIFLWRHIKQGPMFENFKQFAEFYNGYEIEYE